MPLPSEPVTLTAEQIKDLNSKLSTMRHDINNQLAVMSASLELIRHQPHKTEQRIRTLSEQAPRIHNAVVKFSAEFEQAFGITRP